MLIRKFRKTVPVLAAILLSLLCVNSFAQQSTVPERKHPLWKISSKTNTVYLLGSVHLMKQDAYPLDKSIEKAYENSPRLFFEIDLGKIDEKEMQQFTVTKGTYTDGRTLKDVLSKQTYEFAKKRLSDLGLTIEQFERLKPWLLAMVIEISELQKLGFDQNQGIDKYFYKKAKQDKKEVDGFETAEYQLDLLGNIPANMQESLLLQTMKELDDIQNEFTSIIDAWKSGDVEALDKSLLKSFKNYPDVYKALITDRNKNWLPKIEALIGQKENAMIIVGFAHLAGKDGILAAFKEKGYQVEQL